MRRWGDGQGKHLTGTEHVPREGARVFSGSTQGGCQRSLGKHAQLCLSSLRRPLPRWGPSTARARPRDQGHVPILGLPAAAPIQGSGLTGPSATVLTSQPNKRSREGFAQRSPAMEICDSADLVVALAYPMASS